MISCSIRSINLATQLAVSLFCFKTVFIKLYWSDRATFYRMRSLVALKPCIKNSKWKGKTLIVGGDFKSSIGNSGRPMAERQDLSGVVKPMLPEKTS